MDPNLVFDASGQTYYTSGQSVQPYEHYDPSVQPYDNSGQPYNDYDPTAYDNSEQTYDTSVLAGGQLYDADGQLYNDAAPQNAAPQDGWIDTTHIQPGPPQFDVAALFAAHNELSEKLKHMNIQYNETVNNTVSEQMRAYQESVNDDMNALRAQRDAAQAQVDTTARQMAETIARLERERYVSTLVFLPSLSNAPSAPSSAASNLPLPRTPRSLPRLPRLPTRCMSPLFTFLHFRSHSSLQRPSQGYAIQGAGYSIPEASPHWSAQATPSSASEPSSF
jgi:hypothetical protein